jgi:hypothetical protein
MKIFVLGALIAMQATLPAVPVGADQKTFRIANGTEVAAEYGSLTVPANRRTPNAKAIVLR